MKPPFKKKHGAKGSANAAAVRQMQAKLGEGVALHQKGQLAQAREIYRQILEAQPQHFDALHLSGVIAAQTKDPEQAVDLIGKATKINPGNAAAFSNLGNALQSLKKHSAAIESYDRAIALKPDYAEAHNNRGNSLHDMNEPRAALASFDRAIAIKPDYAEAHNNRGNALQDLGQLDLALASYDQAIALNATFAEAYNNRGNALRALNQNGEAIKSFDKAIALNQAYAEAHNNRGNAQQDLRQHVAAIGSYDRAIALRPAYARAFYNRGTAHQHLQQYRTAVDNYDQATILEPDMAFLAGTRLHARMFICDWDGIDEQVADLDEKVRQGKRVTQPFPFLGLTGSPALQHKAAETWIAAKFPSHSQRQALAAYPGHERIRIGYYSCDFHDHPIAHLIAELMELHDSARFELVAFSSGPDQNDDVRQRISAAFDKFVDVRDKSDGDVALLSRQLEIDIAIDLNGFTGNGRPGIFHHRAAPIQVSYLGYPGTMAAPFMDYLIADTTLIPSPARQHYTEKIVYLPHSYQANDSKKRIAATSFAREALGLPVSGFVFCCFNNTYKITRETFDRWMRILRQVNGSVLWLLESNAESTANLRKEAIARRVDGDRLIFARRLPLAEHLARHRAADLFVDTFPYNAHTTASDALWAGLPVLTFMGEAFSSRVAASLLNAIDLPELIAGTQEEYETLAIDLATHPRRLADLRQRLEINRTSAPLFDSDRFTRNLEQAYTLMHARLQANLPAEDIHFGKRPQS